MGWPDGHPKQAHFLRERQAQLEAYLQYICAAGTCEQIELLLAVLNYPGGLDLDGVPKLKVGEDDDADSAAESPDANGMDDSKKIDEDGVPGWMKMTSGAW